MASLARRIAPAAALGGLAVVIVGVADPALAGHSDAVAGSAPSAAAASSPPATASGDGTADVPTSDAPTASDGTCTGDDVVGDTVATRWGPVQVTATVSDGAVCAVRATQWPTGDGRSQQINAYAVPQLDAWASASPTQFDYVSGATYTSEGYHESLQSILDAL